MKKTAKLPKTLTTVTSFSKFLAVIIIFAFILAGVYVGMAYQRTIDATQFSSYLVASSAKNSTTKTITLQDNGNTFNLHVGDIVDFQLGSVSQKWTLSFSPNSILKRVTMGIAQKSGQAGRYLITRDGTVVVTGTGVANCPAGTICPMYAIHFVVTINVSK